MKLQQYNYKKYLDANYSKKTAHGDTYPFNEITSRAFEILIYKIFKTHIETKKRIVDGFNQIDLMSGVAEKGIDNVLTSHGKINGIIQCKRVSKNLNEEAVSKEIIKFLINAIINKKELNLIYNPSSFKYFFVVSKGFTSDCVHFINDFNQKIIKESNLKIWTEKVIAENTNFSTANLTFKKLEKDLKYLLSSIKLIKITPEEDLISWLNEYPEIVKQFFTIKTITENNYIDYKFDQLAKLLNQKEEKELNAFIIDYPKAAIKKFNVINFFGLELKNIKDKPIDVTLTDLYVNPIFKSEVSTPDTILVIMKLLKSQVKLDNELSKQLVSLLHSLKETNHFMKNDASIELNKAISLIKEQHENLTTYELNKLLAKSLFLKYYNPNKQGYSINDLLKKVNYPENRINLVILGNPGSGKSLFGKWLSIHILNQNKSLGPISPFKNVIPFRIILRDYAKEITFNASIVDFLTKKLKDFEISISREVLDTILKNTKTIIFFDGLDEIFDMKIKYEVKNSIEIFSDKYHNSSCIVTSRATGFSKNYFNSFKEFSINPFTNSQINELVNKFFSYQHISKKRKEEFVTSTIQQLNSVNKELKTNPLLLTLLIILVKNYLELPKSKLEIYEYCTTTLVQNWDRVEKNLKLDYKVKNIRAVFGYLAFSLYQKLSAEEKSYTYRQAIKLLTEYLLNKKEYEEYEMAEEAVSTFLEYAEKRSIYFENNFTHKTFLEYYTADYIYLKYETKGKFDDRNDLIGKYIHNPFWSIVFELLLLRIDKNQEDTEVLDDLLMYQIEKMKEQDVNVIHSTTSILLSILHNLKNISLEIIAKLLALHLECIYKGRNTLGESLSKNNFISDNFWFLMYSSELRIRSVQSFLNKELNVDRIDFCLTYSTRMMRKNMRVPLDKLLTQNQKNWLERERKKNISLFFSTLEYYPIDTNIKEFFNHFSVKAKVDKKYYPLRILISRLLTSKSSISKKELWEKIFIELSKQTGNIDDLTPKNRMFGLQVEALQKLFIVFLKTSVSLLEEYLDSIFLYYGYSETWLKGVNIKALKRKKVLLINEWKVFPSEEDLGQQIEDDFY